MQDDDRPWVIQHLEDAFGDATVVRKGVLVDASILPGFVATEGGRPVGFLTCEPARSEARWSPSSAWRREGGSAVP